MAISMKRILIIGSGGAGKSTLARQLAATTGLPVVHLDALYWRSGWAETPKSEWQAIVAEQVSQPEWIMDGNFKGTLDLRLAACDTILFLDLPPWLCVWQILKRLLTYWGQTRPDMAPGCDERISAEFLHWVCTYRRRQRPRIMATLAAAQDQGKQVLILRSRREVAHFLQESKAE